MNSLIIVTNFLYDLNKSSRILWKLNQGKAGE